MDLDKLKKVTTVVSHASCPDGTASAMMCKIGFMLSNLNPEIKFVQYDTVGHRKLVPNRNCLFVDITPHLSDWEYWKKYEPIVLDHHESAKDAVTNLDGIYGDENESGASLAYEYVMKPLLIERGHGELLDEWKEYSNLCMIRDTWKKDDVDWYEAQAFAQALSFHGGQELLKYIEVSDFRPSKLMKLGRALYDKAMRKATMVSRNSFVETLEINGKQYKIGYFNCTEKLISEIGNELINKFGCDLAVGFFFIHDRGNDDLIVSMRSNEKRIHSNLLAEMYGGGGHKASATFRMPEASDISLNGIKMKIRSGLNQILS